MTTDSSTTLGMTGGNAVDLALCFLPAELEAEFRRQVLVGQALALATVLPRQAERLPYNLVLRSGSVLDSFSDFPRLGKTLNVEKSGP